MRSRAKAESACWRISLVQTPVRPNRAIESIRTSRCWSNYNDRVLALRYVYVLALSLWFGGTIVVGVLAAPVSEVLLRRFFRVSYFSGGLLIASLFAMALLGPRPSGFFARMGVAVAMYVVTIY